MDFKEKALEAYKNSKVEDDEITRKEAENFCNKALEALKEQFVDIDLSKVVVEEKLPGQASVIVDNILIRINRGHGYYHFTMVKKCDKCGSEYTHDVRKIADIGEFIMKEHGQYDCEKTIEAKMVHVPTVEEKFMDALKELIYSFQDQ